MVEREEAMNRKEEPEKKKSSEIFHATRHSIPTLTLAAGDGRLNTLPLYGRKLWSDRIEIAENREKWLVVNQKNLFFFFALTQF
jgi:hypothetical protein